MKEINAALFAMCIAWAMPASANAQTLPVRLAQAGKPLKIIFMFSLEPDCHSRGKSVVLLVTPPAHGTISTKDMMDFPNVAQSDSAFPCDRRKVPGTEVYYEGAPDYSGPDTFTVQGQFPDGIVKNFTYNVLVR